MVEPIRAVRTADCYSECTQNIRANNGRYTPRARDTVRFSREAIEMSKKFLQPGGELSDERRPETDRERQGNMNLLRLGQDATAEEIRAAYLEAIKRYHPDRYQTLPPEFRELAEEKTKEINSAYTRLTNRR